jgi:nucleoid DNA-binding protein
MEKSMSSVHETAYPRFKPNLTNQELVEIYTPSLDECKFVCDCVRAEEQLSLLVLLKIGQRLGYFINPSEVPANITDHIAKCAQLEHTDNEKFLKLEKTGSRHRLRDLARNYLGIKAFDLDSKELVSRISEEAAETKQELADIINVVIEEMVRQRIELPGFSTLQRVARRSRSNVNNRLYDSIHGSLSPKIKNQLTDMLEIGDGHTLSTWQKLKQEPKKPTNKEVRSYLIHLSWLKQWVASLPDVNQIPVARWRQMVLESRALDIAGLKKLKPAKRYALIVVLSHSQLRNAMDDAVTILIRKLNDDDAHSRYFSGESSVALPISNFLPEFFFFAERPLPLGRGCKAKNQNST